MVGISTDNPQVRPHEIIEDVWFGDEGSPTALGPYTFTATEAPDLLSAYMYDDYTQYQERLIRAKLKWLESGFDEEVGDDENPLTAWEQVQEAIEDPDHWMRSKHLFGMYNALMEEVSKRPPTSPSGSTRTPSRTAGAARRKPRGSTSGD